MHFKLDTVHTNIFVMWQSLQNKLNKTTSLKFWQSETEQFVGPNIQRNVHVFVRVDGAILCL